jgi:hypothetical protein
MGPQRDDIDEDRLTHALDACTRRLGRLMKRQAALRRARLQVRMGVTREQVLAELRATLTDRPAQRP